MLCLVYDASFDGFLTAVFEAFRLKDAEAFPVRADAPVPALFETKAVDTDEKKAGRVAEGIRRLSPEFLKTAYRAWLSEFPGIDDDILRALRLGFSAGRNPADMRCEPCVARVCEADRRVGTEAFRYYCFVRFADAGRGLFIADIEPAFDILPLIGQHFHARYRSQRFLIRDLSRRRAVVSDADGWCIAELSGEQLSPAGKGGAYERLWERYFISIANASRKNTRLQQKYIPLRYRKFMTEFQGE